MAATNYPLVRITNNATGHVFYARTHNHSTMAVATGSATVSTKFDVPASIELGSSSLVVVANGIPSQPVSVNVSAPSPTPTPAATPTPSGKIALSANPVVFPSAGLGEAPTGAHFIVQNLSGKNHLVGNVGSPGVGSPFSVVLNSGAFNLGPLGTRTVRLRFTPTGLGLETGSLVVTSNDNAHRSVTVNLKGTGLPGRLATNVSTAPTFTSLSETLLFGAVKENGTPKLLSFRIKNIGAGELQGNVGSLAAPFTVTAGSRAFDLAPGATEKVTVQFAPTALGHVSQPLAITVTAPSKPPAGITVTVGGRGT